MYQHIFGIFGRIVERFIQNWEVKVGGTKRFGFYACDRVGYRLRLVGPRGFCVFMLEIGLGTG